MIQKQAEILWREEKYRVMLHSQYYYNKIRAAMKNENYSEVPTLVQEALQVSPTAGSQRNAIMHMWGYFKKRAQPEEKAMYQQLLQADNFKQLLLFLRQLAIKYKITYLMNSRVLLEQKR